MLIKNKKVRTIGKVFLVGITVFAVLFQLSSTGTLSSLASTFEEKLTHKCVNLVKDNYMPDTKVTIEDTFKNYFGSPKWKYMSTDKGDVVEFDGVCRYQNQDVKCSIQYIVNPKDSTYQFYAMAFNNIPQNDFVFVALSSQLQAEAYKLNGNKSSKTTDDSSYTGDQDDEENECTD